MRPLREMTVIQIEITNACSLKCATAQGMLDIIENPFLWNWITLKKQSTLLMDTKEELG